MPCQGGRRAAEAQRCIACADMPRRTPGDWRVGGGHHRALHVKHLVRKAASKMEQQSRGLWFKYPPRAGGTLLSPQPSLDRRAQENPGPVEQRSKRHSKQRKQARCREQRSPGVRGHCFCRRHPRQKVFIMGGLTGLSPGPSSSSQALTAGGGAGPVVRIQGTKPKVTVLWNAPLCPQHPGVGSNLVQGGPLGGPQGETPLNKLLALCRGNRGQSPAATLPCSHTAPGYTTHLGRPSSGKKACHARSPRPAQRECPHTPCRRAVHPGTTQWQTARDIGDIGSTLGGCTHECLREESVLGIHTH